MVILHKDTKINQHMKFLRILASVFVLVILAGGVNAQTFNKTEKKKLKKEIKAYKKDPASYKKMKIKNKEGIDSRDDIITNLTAQLDEANVRNRALSDSLNAITRRYSALMIKYRNSNEVPNGTVYAVQIGYFKQLDLKSFNGEPKRIKAEVVGEAKRYVMGYFTKLEDAVAFGSEIQKLGVSDAFVSEYINGTRNMEFDSLKVK
ncbi:MAG: septal ring factor EnvC (AmiA/AmiB activator) [Bacteroidia bacterium]